MKTFANRLHKLGITKMLQTDERSGPTTRPAFAKATQVKSMVGDLGSAKTSQNTIKATDGSNKK